MDETIYDKIMTWLAERGPVRVRRGLLVVSQDVVVRGVRVMLFQYQGGSQTLVVSDVSSGAMIGLETPLSIFLSVEHFEKFIDEIVKNREHLCL